MAQHATIAQVLQIGDLLKNYCILDEETGLAHYLSGWSDEAIAEKVGCSKASVARVRTQTIGRLFNRNLGIEDKGDDDRIKALELKVEQQATAISAMQNQIKAIMANVTAYDREVQSMASKLLSSTSIAKAS